MFFHNKRAIGNKRRSRRMRFSIAVLLVSSTLTGCGTSATADRIIKSHYLGKNADYFFADFGPAEQSQELSIGGQIYIWSSGVDNYAVPTTQSGFGAASSYGTYSGVGITSGGGVISVECRVKILTDKDHAITNITVQDDSLGKWEWSRCHEIFKEKGNANDPA